MFLFYKKRRTQSLHNGKIFIKTLEHVIFVNCVKTVSFDRINLRAGIVKFE